MNDKLYQAKEHYIHRKVAGTDILIPIAGNIANFNGCIEMNDTAAALWQKLQFPSTIRQLELYLQETFGIDQNEASGDVTDFLEQLQTHQMIGYSEKK